MEVVAFGFDTLKPVFDCSEALPIFDLGYRDELVARGFKQTSKRFVDPRKELLVESLSWSRQDSKSRSLRLQIWNSRDVAAEFSAACLKSGSVLNVDLASTEESYALVDEVRSQLQALLPEAGTLRLKKLGRADCAADVKTGESIRDIVDLFSHMQLEGSRKVERVTYLHQGVMINAPTQSFCVYPKGIELESKLTPKEREQFAKVIAGAKVDGRLRFEYRAKPRGGASVDYLADAPRIMAEKLQSGFPNGWAKTVSSLRALVDQVDVLPLSYYHRSELIADAVRHHSYGLNYIRQQVTPRTFQRKVSQAKKFPIHFKDNMTEVIEVDFTPLVEGLKAA